MSWTVSLRELPRFHNRLADLDGQVDSAVATNQAASAPSRCDSARKHSLYRLGLSAFSMLLTFSMVTLASPATAQEEVIDNPAGGDITNPIDRDRGLYTITNAGSIFRIDIDEDVPDGLEPSDVEARLTLTNEGGAVLNGLDVGDRSYRFQSFNRADPTTNRMPVGYTFDTTVVNEAGAEIRFIDGPPNTSSGLIRHYAEGAFRLTNRGLIEGRREAVIQFGSRDTVIVNEIGGEIRSDSTFNIFLDSNDRGENAFELSTIHGLPSFDIDGTIPVIDNSGVIDGGGETTIYINGPASIINRSHDLSDPDATGGVIGGVNANGGVPVAIEIDWGRVENQAGATITGGIFFNADDTDASQADPIGSALVLNSGFLNGTVLMKADGALYGATEGSAHTGQIRGGTVGVQIAGKLLGDIVNEGQISGLDYGLLIFDPNGKSITNRGLIAGDNRGDIGAPIFEEDNPFSVLDEFTVHVGWGINISNLASTFQMYRNPLTINDEPPVDVPVTIVNEEGAEIRGWIWSAIPNQTTGAVSLDNAGVIRGSYAVDTDRGGLFRFADGGTLLNRETGVIISRNDVFSSFEPVINGFPQRGRGPLVVDNHGLIVAGGHGVGNADIDNRDFLDDPGATFVMTLDFVNHATGRIYAEEDGVIFQGDTDFVNNGYIEAVRNGVYLRPGFFFPDVRNTFENNGSILAGFNGVQMSQGSFLNSSTGTITSTGGSTAVSVGGAPYDDPSEILTFVNHGTIHQTGVNSGASGVNVASMSFLNTGTIIGPAGVNHNIVDNFFINDATITGTQTFGVVGSDMFVDFVNNGDVLGADTGYFVFFQHDHKVVNAADATITGTTENGVYLFEGGALDNAGTIKGGQNAVNVVTMTDRTIRNRTGGIIETTSNAAGYAAVAIYGGTGTLVNEKDAFIQVAATGNTNAQGVFVGVDPDEDENATPALHFTNDGTIDAGPGRGVDFDTNAIVLSFNNSGIIRGADNAVEISDLGTATLYNRAGGLIETTSAGGGWAGVAVFGGNGKLVNEKDATIAAPNGFESEFTESAIFVGSGATGFEIDNAGTLTGIYTINSNARAVIKNSSVISVVSGQQGDAVNLFSGGTFDNLSGGIVTATRDAFYIGDDSNTGVLTVVRNASGATITGGGSAIFSADDDDDTDATAGREHVFNAGAINGSVSLGAGSDLFAAVDGGTVSGTVDGGTGTDIVQYAAETADQAFSSSFTGFEELEKTGSFATELTNSFAAERARIEGGTLIFGRNAGDGVSTAPGALALSDLVDGLTMSDGDAGITTMTTLIVRGANSLIDSDGVAGGASIALTGDEDRQVIVNDRARIEANISLGGGDDKITNAFGTYQGNIDLGLGNDELEVFLEDNGLGAAVGGTITGAVTGGEGIDTLRYSLETGTATLTSDAASDIGAPSAPTSFERIAKGGAGTVIFDFDEVDIGGSTLTTNAFDIEGPAQFDDAVTAEIVAGDVTSGIVRLGQATAPGTPDGFAEGQITNNNTLTAQRGIQMTGLTRIVNTSGQSVTTEGGLGITGDNGAQTLTNAGTIILTGGGRIALAGGADRVETTGAISGSIDLGTDDDVLVMSSLGDVTETSDGGSGMDNLFLDAGSDGRFIAAGDFMGFETVDLNVDSAATGTFEIAGANVFAADGGELSDVTLHRGAIQGTGEISGSLTILGDATIAPGSSIGTISIAGDYVQRGTYALEVRAPTDLTNIRVDGALWGRNQLDDVGLALAKQDADLIRVAGTADLTGGSLAITLTDMPQAYADALDTSGASQLRYLVLRATGGLGGSQLAALSADGVASVEYADDTDVVLVLVEATDDIDIVGSAPPVVPLDAADWSRPRCDLEFGQVASTGRCAFFSGELRASSANGSDAPGAVFDDDDGLRGLAGMGWDISEDRSGSLWAGVAIDFADRDYALSFGQGDADENRFDVSLWAQYNDGPVDLRGWLTFRDSDVKTHVRTSRGDLVQSDQDTQGMSLQAEARHWYELDNGMQVTPLLRLSAGRLRRDGFTERTDGLQAFVAESGTQSSFRATLGGEMRWESEAFDRPALWTAGLGWSHEFGDTKAELAGYYVNDPTRTRFTSDGIDRGRNAFRASVSLGIAVSDRSSFTTSYSASNDSYETDHRISFQYSVAFN